MWIIAKIKIKNLHTFKKELTETTGVDIKFYLPKYEYEKHLGNKIKKFEKFNYAELASFNITPFIDYRLST